MFDFNHVLDKCLKSILYPVLYEKVNHHHYIFYENGFCYICMTNLLLKPLDRFANGYYKTILIFISRYSKKCDSLS